MSNIYSIIFISVSSQLLSVRPNPVTLNSALKCSPLGMVLKNSLRNSLLVNFSTVAIVPMSWFETK